MAHTEIEFAEHAEQYRAELTVHCYRMLGTLQDAEDMVQETFLRAVRAIKNGTEYLQLRPWLYKIATNACLDVLKKQSRRYIPLTHEAQSNVDDPIPTSIYEPIWLEPLPDAWLSEDVMSPEHVLLRQETISMAFMAVLQLLPPRQRVVLIFRDVLGWHADEVATALNMTVSAVKSALHRARTTMAEHTQHRQSTLLTVDDPQWMAMQKAYVEAWEAGDVEKLVVLLRNDATFSMPPIPSWYQGQDTIRRLVSRTIFAGQSQGRWRLLPTRANGQIAFGLYRISDDQTAHHAYGIQLLQVSSDGIGDILTFRVPNLVQKFGLPASI